MEDVMSNNQVWKSDAYYHRYENGYWHAITDADKIAEVEAYLLDHPEALIPEPVPPEPTQEELDRREEQSLLAYLASTDWYAVRYAETGTPVPEEVSKQREDARERISELRA
jgi:hypothetical protein